MHRRALLSLFAFASVAGAQMRPVIDTTTVSAAAGLNAIVQAYQKELLANPHDGTSWHDLGMAAWRLQSVLARSGNAGSEPARIGRLADSALAMAAAIELNNAQYQMDAAWRLQAAKLASVRVGSRRYLDRAVTISRTKNDGIMHAVAALEYGRSFWWRFDAFENRYLFTGLRAPRSVADALNPLARAGGELEYQALQLNAAEKGINPDLPVGMLKSMVGASTPDIRSTGNFAAAENLLRTTSKALPNDLSGHAELEKATMYFNEAYQASPGYPGTFRAVAQTWVARNAWLNLERFASAHLRSFPRDSMAWMALALAQYRQGKLRPAQATFDSLFKVISPKEADHLMSFRRMLSPQIVARMAPDELKSKEALYWRAAQPFMSDSSRNPRLEFMARVAHAELRWSVEEFGLSGADSDRGDVFIRYGPPSKVMNFGGSVTDETSDVVTFWIYDSGLIFAFTGMPTFAVMRTAADDNGLVAELRAMFPSGWGNIDVPKTDSLQSFVARFRAAKDSVDLSIAVDFPAPDSISRTMSVASPVLKQLWVIPTGRSGAQHVSSTLTASGIEMWREQVGTGTMMYRAEAFGETATRGARVTGIIDASESEFATTGFGVSDLLIARSVAESGAATARRWSDLGAVPSIGRIDRNAPISFVWENYEFGDRGGQAEYDVTLTIKSRKSSAPMAGEVLGALARLVRIDRGPSQVSFNFSRTVPYARAFADWVTVRVPDAPEGEYDATVVIRDRVTGKEVARSSRVTIRG